MYEIRIYIKGQPGFFSYEVEDLTQAMIHYGEIVSGGYRRHEPNRSRLTWYPPSRIHEVNVIGHGLDTNYPDQFKRT